MVDKYGYLDPKPEDIEKLKWLEDCVLRGIKSIRSGRNETYTRIDTGGDIYLSELTTYLIDIEDLRKELLYRIRTEEEIGRVAGRGREPRKEFTTKSTREPIKVTYLEYKNPLSMGLIGDTATQLIAFALP